MIFGDVKQIPNSTELQIEVSVTDEGIGISEEDQTRVFQGFLRTKNQESKSMNQYGNGIGLSFCK